MKTAVNRVGASFVLAAGLVLSTASLTTAQQSAPAPTSTLSPIAPQSVQRISEALSGRWLGTLEYRDYRTDARVKLPTLLETTTEAPGSLRVHYTFDDGNGKIVQDRATLHIDGGAGTYVETDDDKSVEPYRIASFSGFNDGGKAQIILLGHGTENDKPVDVRTTLDLGSRTLSMLRETRVVGGDFLFRHRYAFSRLP